MKSAAQHIPAQGKPNKNALHKSEGTFFGIQAKLTVGKPNDKFEKEADAVADKIINTPEPKQTFFGTSNFFTPQPGPNQLQKTETQEIQKQEENEEIQEKPNLDTTISKVQLAGTDDENSQQSSHLNSLNHSIQRAPFEEVQAKPKSSKNTPVIQLQPFENTEPIQEKEMVQRKEKGTPVISDTITVKIQRASSQGTPLSKDVRAYMEPRFQTDFSNVRVHNNQEGASLSNQLSARAFTYKNNIFFNKGEYQPETTSGKHLLAHELTHVVQQRQAVQLKPKVKETQSQPQVQRLGVSDALDYFADKANHIPGFRMFTILLGLNPINMSSVERSAANIMRAIVEFLPGGFLITQVLDKYDVFDEAAGFMKTQLDSLSLTGSTIKRSIDDFLDSLSWKDIFNLSSVWDRGKRIITAPITQVINLGKSVVSAIIDMVKKAVLKPLAALAEGTQGYDLLKALLGEDPITGDPYPATAENVIGGFMKLIGQEEVWQNIVEGNAVAKAWMWFQEAMSGLVAFAKSIPGTIIAALNSLTWEDFVILPNAFIKVGKAFVDIASGYISWAMGTVISLLEILFSVVAPGVLPYIQKAQGAFHSILKNPIGFVSNLVQAAKMGFQQFAAKIGEHLKNSLLNWLLGSLAGAGIYIPQGLTFHEIIKFVASVLGLTWENLRAKLVKHLGEPAVKALEAGFEIVKILVTEGPAAAWEKILEHLSNLQSMVIQEISQFVIVKVVQNAIAKLVTSLNPAGAVIQAIIAIYQTITFLIDKIKEIAQVGMAVIDSISAIANGVLTEAANKVEKTLAGMLTLAVNFLAKFAGLGKISDAIINIIKKIRQPVDTAMDKVVEWLVNTVKSFLNSEDKSKVVIGDGEIGENITFTAADEGHSIWINESDSPKIMVASSPTELNNKIAEWQNKLTDLSPENKTKAQGLLSSVSQNLIETENLAQKTKNEIIKAENELSPEIVAKAEAYDDETETTEGKLTPDMIQLFDIFEGGLPFETIQKNIVMDGGNDSLEIIAGKNNKSLDVQVAKKPINDLFVQIVGGPIGSAHHSHGLNSLSSLASSLQGSIDSTRNLPLNEGKILSSDKTIAINSAEQISGQLSSIGSTFKVANFNRMTTQEKIDEVVLSFNYKMEKNPAIVKEYERQLNEQETGLNKLDIDQWKLNRNAYTLDENKFKDIDSQERITVLNELRRRANDAKNKATRNSKKYEIAITAIDEAMNNYDTDGFVPNISAILPVTGRFGNEKTWRRLNKNQIKEIKEILKNDAGAYDSIFNSLAVLHNADQIAGGFGEIPLISDFPKHPDDGGDASVWQAYLDNLKQYVGSRDVNSSIGSLWKDQVNVLETNISKYEKVSWSLWKMNVKLK